MFGNRLICFITVSRLYVPKIPDIDITWGKATHFIHDDDTDFSEGRPLNKEWDISISWLWFSISLTYDKELEEDE